MENLLNLPNPFSYCIEDDETKKKCPTCGEYEPKNDFSICRVGPYKNLSLCNGCVKQEHEEHRTEFGSLLAHIANDFKEKNS